MFSFSARSKKNLDECHEDLVKIFNQVIQNYDCAIICGARDEETQNALFHSGQSKLQYPDSKHNVSEEEPKSMAVDAVPYPVDWEDRESFYHFAGYVKGVADVLYEAGEIDHVLRCGCDWDGDCVFDDQTFHDFPHFELKKID